METDPIAEAEALIASGRGAEAARGLRARLAEGRGGLLTRLTLVKALRESDDMDGALEEAREASSLNPTVAAAAAALGEVLLRRGALPAAIAELQRALKLDPGLEEARFLTGLAWLEAGEADKALEIFESLNATPVLAPQIERARAIRRAPRSDAGYVRHLFDQFSADYDARMIGQLAYAAPQILRDLADLVMPGQRDLVILDLGCGTGLAGAIFQDKAARLDGIDLSPAMLEKARARGIYNRLHLGDIESLSAERYDLILAADTLVYLGDLAPVFRTAAASLARDGYFLFTTEAADGSGFELGPKRRWRHSETYLRETAARAGLAVAGLVAASPRTEANKAVAGFAVALTRA